MQHRILHYTQTRLSQIVIFGKTFSREKLLFQIFPLNMILLQGNCIRRTRHPSLNTFKPCLMIGGTRLTTRSTRSTRLPTHSAGFVTSSTHLLTCSTRLSICLSTCSTSFSTRSTRLSTCSSRFSTRSICLPTISTCNTICRSFYDWSDQVILNQCCISIETTFRFSLYDFKRTLKTPDSELILARLQVN